MAKQFNDGILDLSSLRAKKQEEKKLAFDASAIMASVPSGYSVLDEDGNPAEIVTENVVVTVENIFLIMKEKGAEEQAPFMMIAKHENNAIVDSTLRPPTQEEFEECQTIIQQAAIAQQQELFGETEFVEEATEEPLTNTSDKEV